MSFSVQLYKNASPIEKIGKSLTLGPEYNINFKEDSSILRPRIIILDGSSAVYEYNYMYISTFGRYYFIDDIISVANNRWEIHSHVDVLETYKNMILANEAVIKRQEKQYNLYLDDPEFKAYNYDQIQTLKFSTNGFIKNLKYVLVVNGS